MLSMLDDVEMSDVMAGVTGVAVVAPVCLGRTEQLV